MKVYKIRDKDGQYANGQKWSFGPEGKTWTTMRRCKGHLALFKCVGYYPTKHIFYDIPSDWIVEEYELVKVNEYSAKELMEKK